jgi:hypothetical protein
MEFKGSGLNGLAAAVQVSLGDIAAWFKIATSRPGG